ncbi:uncharacterized protein TRIVIDRAFT_201713 [Trichoderma virens Gv29-8]|uniref:Uncharacterized protein n=1 Tax=Hypocrea virens (strain Gv29-8 / FGSC 10586) TaxID=413071 RepID=G9MUV1_HYPVG|nr:uncharacterized protein TRIVIDRAFT_201713 [Trichoderma virens Gv29-8]EHK21766.1 hypothetical protein TRIVIDRAFT_201713 [Trichoderma virens Gv29-8]
MHLIIQFEEALFSRQMIELQQNNINTIALQIYCTNTTFLDIPYRRLLAKAFIAFNAAIPRCNTPTYWTLHEIQFSAIAKFSRGTQALASGSRLSIRGLAPLKTIGAPRATRGSASKAAETRT